MWSDARATGGRLFLRATIECRVETQFGDEVVCCGSTEQLGMWQPERAIRLATDESIFPIWRCEPLLLCADEIEFKFVVIRKGGAIEWEPLPNNRRVPNARALENLQIAVDWGSPSAPTFAVPGPQIASPAPGGVSSASGESASRNLPPVSVAPAADTPDPSLVERLLVVMHHLPLLLTQEPGGQWHVEWDESSLLATSVQGGRHLLGALHLEVIFVGLPRVQVPPTAEKQVAEACSKLNCVPVFMPAPLRNDGRKVGFASQVLWPLLHNQLPDRHAGDEGGDGTVVARMWQAYIATNEAFAATVRATLRPGDMVWIQNFHLLLLPAKLREPAEDSASSGSPRDLLVSIFLHTPFPSPEIWRVVPFCKELLQGMLAANVVGFHLFEYARHFMTSCRRLLGLGENVGAGPVGGVLSINLVNRLCTITVSHVGIDRDVTLHRLRQSEVDDKLAALKQRCNPDNRKVIGGVEMLNPLQVRSPSHLPAFTLTFARLRSPSHTFARLLNPLQGASLKLLAYEELLRNYPMWRSRLVMVQVCLPDPSRKEHSQAMSKEMRETAARIHAAFGPEALHYLELGVELETWSVNDRLALFRLCDMYLNCAMRDGLNLLPFEYVLTKSSQQPTSDGIAVLSEFVGCAHVLNGAIRINPFNLEHVVEQIDLTLAMSSQERAARLAKDYNFVRSHSTSSWLKVAVNDMRSVRRTISNSSPSARRTLALSSWPRGARPGEALPKTSPKQVAHMYHAATRRVILLGLDGTLIEQEQVIEHLKLFHDFQGSSAQLSPAALRTLAALAADPKNVVYVISGRTSSDMHATLGHIPGLGLVSELGYLHYSPCPHAGFGDSPAHARLSSDAGAHPLASSPDSPGSPGYFVPIDDPDDDDDDDGDEEGYGMSSPRHAVKKAAAPREGHTPDAWRNSSRRQSGSGVSSEVHPPPGWNQLLETLAPVPQDWREVTCRVIREYTVRTNGAYERGQSSAVQWFYHDADPDFGLLQARFLTAALRDKLSGYGVSIMHAHDKGLVEVRRAGVNKGAAADILLSKADHAAPVDFLLCIGDDDDDEFMISATTARAGAPGFRERLHGRLFTVTVGNRASSHAQCVASDAAEVLGLLEMLTDEKEIIASPGRAGPQSPAVPRGSPRAMMPEWRE